MANKLYAASFEAVRKDPFYQGHPERLHYLLLNVIRDRHQQYLAQEIKRLAGRRVYFWGCDELFQYKSHHFRETKPVCFLDDTFPLKAGETGTVRGLPVCHPSMVLPQGETLPIMIFSANAPAIYRSILKNYSRF